MRDCGVVAKFKPRAPRRSMGIQFGAENANQKEIWPRADKKMA
jgi:hypothetical protein